MYGQPPFVFDQPKTAFVYIELGTRLVLKWRHLVVTFSVEEFSSISQFFYFNAVN